MNKTKKRIQERQLKKQQRKILITVISAGLLLLVSGIFFGFSTWKNTPDPSLIKVSGQPSIKIDRELIDYGDVKLNTNLQFDLVLTNVGDQTLRITDDPYIEVVEGC